MTGKTFGIIVLALIAAGGSGAALYLFQQNTVLKEALTESDATHRSRQQQEQVLNDEIDSLSKTLQRTAAEKRDLEEQLQNLTSQKNDLQKQLAEASSKLSRAASETTSANTRLSRVKSENEELKKRLGTYTAELEQKQSKLQQVSSTHTKLVSELRREIAQSQIKITQLGDSLSVRMVGNILFPTGKAELTDEGVEVLRRVGDIISKVEDKTIRVEGHTDDRPISYPLNTVYPSNWELSTARANNVVHFLTEQINIAPERLEAVGRSQYHPVATNDTAEGRGRNRRIEILLVPPQAEIEETPVVMPEPENKSADKAE